MIVYMAFLFDNKESDLGLQQGADYNKLQHDVIGQQIDFNMKLLEETTMPKIGSIVEGLENGTINDKNNAVTQQMKDLEQEFNEKLSEYTTLYRRYMQNMTSNPSNGQDATWDRITALNNELIGIADRMYQSVTHINSTDEQVDREVKSAGVSLQSRIKQLNDERNKFIQMKSKLQSLEGKYDDSQRNLTSQYTQYMVWSIAAITLGAFAVKYIAKS